MPSVSSFSGIDHVLAIVYGSGCALFGAFMYFAVGPAFAPYVAAVAAAATVIVAARRYRVRVSAEGVEWTLLVGWVFPIQRLRYLLDVQARFYESWEATAPEGVYLSKSWLAAGEADSPCFGPPRQAAIASLRDRIDAAIRQARELAPPPPAALRCGLLAAQERKLDVAGAVRNPHGRIRTLTVREAARVGAIDIPAGSTLDFNRDEYVDPRREDRLVSATLADRIRLPFGFEAGAGTRLGFTESGRIHNVRGALGLLELDGFPVDGNDTIVFDGTDHVHMFTLGRELTMGGWRLPAGTKFMSWMKQQHWYCTLIRPLKLPELELRERDSAIFDKATRRLVRVSPYASFELDGKKHIGPLAVLADGRIDRRNLK